LLVLALGACSFFNKDEPVDPPAELYKFKAQVKPKRVWKARIGDSSEALHLGLNPASDGARVYAAAHDGRISAIDTLSGKRYWEIITKLPLAAGPGVGYGLLALGSSDGDVIAIETVDGNVRWHVTVSSEVLATPAVSPDVVVVRTVDGRLRGFSAENGMELWMVEQDVPPLSLRGNSGPVIVGDIVVCGFDNGHVLAVNLDDGELVWEATVGASRGRNVLQRLADVDTTVRIVGNDIYVASYQGRAAMLALESGQDWWSRDLSSFRDVAADDTNLYLTDERSEIVAMARRDGAPLWRQADLHMRGLSSPAVHGNAVVVGDFEGYLHWISVKNGELLGRAKTGKAAVSGRPLVQDDIVYVLTEDGELLAYTIEWKITGKH
jgi:outer membrane protein assembly factor BamB